MRLRPQHIVASSPRTTREGTTPTKKAGAPWRQPAAQTIPPITNIPQIELSGRELLLTLAENVRELCDLVLAWRDDVDRLRERIAELERGTNDPYKGSRAELADRLQELWNSGWRPQP